MSGEKLFNVDVITPERLRFSGPAQVLSLPGAEGQLAILPNHAPLLALLEPGQLMVRSGNRETHMAVGPGFVKMNQNRAVCLVEFADLPEDLDASALAEDVKALESEGPLRRSPAQAEDWRLRMKVARARLEVARRQGGH